MENALVMYVIMVLLLLELSWRAPELLRSACFPGRGTQKGDVYSFALILFDLHSRRAGPWSSTGLMPQGQAKRTFLSSRRPFVVLAVC